MSSGIAWKKFKLMTFDCYGTLVDWETGILQVLRPWAKAAGVAASNDQLLAAFGAAESQAEHAKPKSLYRAILRDTMKGIAIHYGKKNTATQNSALADSVGNWPVFPDTVEALRTLKYWRKLMVVSNVDKVSFARTAPKLGVALDGLVTAEEVGAYKPNPRMFKRALAVAAKMGIKKDEVLHVAQSLYHDVVPAKALGLTTVWVDRRSGKPGGASPAPAGNVVPHLRVASLRELVDLELVERQRRS
jgi:2-haloalkanoic acid dehalogenase type II